MDVILTENANDTELENASRAYTISTIADYEELESNSLTESCGTLNVSTIRAPDGPIAASTIVNFVNGTSPALFVGALTLASGVSYEIAKPFECVFDSTFRTVGAAATVATRGNFHFENQLNIWCGSSCNNIYEIDILSELPITVQVCWGHTNKTNALVVTQCQAVWSMGS